MPTDERVIELTDIPSCNPGAPLPAILATEEGVLVAYYRSESAKAYWGDDPCAIVEFQCVGSHLFGASNDETLEGHRLYDLYGAFEVVNSHWIAELCARNRVHSRHSDESYAGYRHIILTFHDSTFEIVAEGYSVSTSASTPIDALAKQIRKIQGPRPVYRIITPEDWHEARRRGAFEGSADDKRDGFIHFSTAEQVPGTHDRHYGGKAGLLLLEIDAAKLGDALRYETSRGGALFPHLYGTLPVGAVISVRPLEGLAP